MKPAKILLLVVLAIATSATHVRAASGPDMALSAWRAGWLLQASLAPTTPAPGAAKPSAAGAMSDMELSATTAGLVQRAAVPAQNAAAPAKAAKQQR